MVARSIVVGCYPEETLRKLVVGLAVGVACLAFGCGPKRDEDTREVSSSIPAPPDSTPQERVMAMFLPAEPGHTINRYEVEELRRQGLIDPIAQLIASLQSHREIIPHAGVLGGTVAFYHPENIHVLDSKWVFALFDDGHIAGRGLFAFTVLPDSSITWKVVVSELY